MGRYIGPRYKLCRREGVNLFGSKKFDIERRDYPPGQHGNKKRAKLSDYGIQMREKQKVKRVYGLLEKQFRKYYHKAARSKGVTGTMLLQFLERRLDNTIFRMGFATTRAQARQIVSHGKVNINGRKLNIASYEVKLNDEIELKLKDKNKAFIDKNIEANKDIPKPAWLQIDEKHYKAKVLKMPERDDVQFPINEQLIIELYSK